MRLIHELPGGGLPRRAALLEGQRSSKGSAPRRVAIVFKSKIFKSEILAFSLNHFLLAVSLNSATIVRLRVANKTKDYHRLLRIIQMAATTAHCSPLVIPIRSHSVRNSDSGLFEPDEVALY